MFPSKMPVGKVPSRTLFVLHLGQSTCQQRGIVVARSKAPFSGLVFCSGAAGQVLKSASVKERGAKVSPTGAQLAVNDKSAVRPFHVDVPKE
jgi:hypothetical protein